MSGNYFIQLTESGQTVNLAQVASINWQELPAGWEESDCTATITLASGYYVCITPNDAQELWEALNRYNTRMGQALAALPQLVNNLAALVEAHLAGAGFEEYYNQQQEYSQPQQQQSVPQASRPAGGSSTPPQAAPAPGVAAAQPPGSDHARAGQPSVGNVGSGKVRVNPATASAGPSQPVAQRQRHVISQ